jgi:CheY-like chemotaxis protein
MIKAAKNTSVARDTILVIDDDNDLRSLITTLGELSGIRVLEAANCSIGLKILDKEHERIKLVLLDYFMPGMEPTTCAKAIVAKAGKAIAVFLLTAADDPAARAAQLNVTGWLPKPTEVANITKLFSTVAFPQKETRK